MAVVPLSFRPNVQHNPACQLLMQINRRFDARARRSRYRLPSKLLDDPAKYCDLSYGEEAR